MVVDACKTREECHVGAALAAGVGGLRVKAPLQVGGIAHAPPRHLDHGWPAPITTSAFHGCIRNLRVNGEVRINTVNRDKLTLTTSVERQ